MSEHIISDEQRDAIVQCAYNAGKMGLAEFPIPAEDGEEIVRCRDCKNASETYLVDFDEYEKCPDGKLDCIHFGQWDHYNDKPGYWFVEPDGYCAWGEQRG